MKTAIVRWASDGWRVEVWMAGQLRYVLARKIRAGRDVERLELEQQVRSAIAIYRDGATVERVQVYGEQVG